jgi:hypothetical protein
LPTRSGSDKAFEMPEAAEFKNMSCRRDFNR